MKIINKNKNTILAENACVANSSFKRIKGLLGKKELLSFSALIITPCNSIHTFFMRFPIDAVFVDSNHKVVKTISNMLPFRISGIYFNARSTIELPAGTIKQTSTQIGDYLTF